MDTLSVETLGSRADRKKTASAMAGSEAAPRPPRHSHPGEAATALSEFLVQMAFSSAAVSSTPLTDANATLALAATKLRQHDHPEASKLFATVVHSHDVREGWLGLAIAYHFQGENVPPELPWHTHYPATRLPLSLQLRIPLRSRLERWAGVRWTMRAP
jgi:hypothetical protein